MLWISTRFGLCIEVAGKPVPDVLRFILITPKPQYSNIMETQSLSCAPHTITGQNQALLDVSSLIWQPELGVGDNLENVCVCVSQPQYSDQRHEQ